MVQASLYHTFDSSLDIAPLFYMGLEPFIVLLVDLILLLKQDADIDVIRSLLDCMLGPVDHFLLGLLQLAQNSTQTIVRLRVCNLMLL